MKKQFLILFAFISVLALSQVPQRFNKVIVTGDITSPKFIKTGSNADSVLLGNGSARSVNSLKTDTVSLSNRINAKAAGNGTANGTNTGDETLTSIKTKLGAATSVSDGYLKYQDFALLHTPTTVTASNGLSISGQNISLQNASLTQSGALTFNDWNTFNSKEPAITKNTGFNLPLGNTPGTVLEGDGTAANSTLWNSQWYTNSPQPADYIMATDGNGTWGYITKPNFKSSLGFGTASNSGVGDFIQNQNTSAQTGNSYVSGRVKGSFFETSKTENNDIYSGGEIFLGGTYNSLRTGLDHSFNIDSYNEGSYKNILNIKRTGDALFSSSVSAQNYIAPYTSNGSILTPAFDKIIRGVKLNTNESFISFGNEFANTPGTYIKFTVNSNSANSTPIDALILKPSGGATFLNSVTASSFYGNGSNLTGVQLPITLTTNGTSGAATFSGNVLNVPNYTSSGAYVNISPSSVQSGSIWIDGIVKSSTVSAPSINTSYINFNSIPNGQQTSGSVSGNVIFNMPFNGAFYKKVIITLLNLQGSASWTFTSSFSNLPVVLNTDGLPSSIVTSKSLTSITLNCATPTSGILILEGY